MNINENGQNHFLSLQLFQKQIAVLIEFSRYELATVGNISIVPFLIQLSPENGPMKYFCMSLCYPLPISCHNSGTVWAGILYAILDYIVAHMGKVSVGTKMVTLRPLDHLSRNDPIASIAQRWILPESMNLMP